VSVVRRSEVDGVQAFWVDSGRPTLTASLVTRQGMVDETLPTTGWTHLLEHLALHDRASGPLHVNGSVSLLHTRLDAHGPADRVAQVLEALTGWIAEPRFDELAREQSVLRAEAAMRGAGEVSIGLLWRYGAGGPGLSGYAEPGLSRADSRALTGLAHQAFTRGNTVLFLDGPPPEGLSLHLPDGPLRRAPRARPCDDTLPAAYLSNAGITLSGVVPRSVAGTVVPHVLREVLTAEFRERDGGAYAPWAHYEPVDDESAVVFAGSDANDALLQSIADRAIFQLGQVAKGVFKTSLVTDTVEQLVQAMSDPYNLPGLAFRAATDHLRGEAPLDLEEVLEEYRAVDLDAVVESAAAMRSSLMVGIAREARWTQEMPILGMPSGAAMVEGRGHRSLNFPAHRERLVVGREAVQIGSAKDFRTVRRDEVAGMFVYPDGAREVVARDGWSIDVEPTLWSAGAEATRGMDAMVPADLHIPMLSRGPDRVPRPMSFWRRLHHLTQQGNRRFWVVAAGLFLLWIAILVGATMVTGRVPVGGVIGGLAVGAWSFLRERKRE
jgi:hypothetical protein